MTTPIFDFVKKYADIGTARCHMPGHKGTGALGCEAFDITEISGADVLYSAEGIIAESENNLTELYGTSHSFYSTEGSTLVIKAMLALVSERAGGERPLILAARNVHAAFVRGAALLDLDVEWIYPASANHLCACPVGADEVAAAIDGADRVPSAVYLTSPDYLGNILDISAISRVCRERNIPLLVDNAHGAYLKFLPEDIHPITLGATMCADSAHKTLPVLTGGAYLHISPDHPEYADRARGALSIFASTSPSYLTLCSLDLCNRELGSDYSEKIASLVKEIDKIKADAASVGLPICESEPLKIVIRLGDKLADHLRTLGIEPEFSDRDYTVLMLTPGNDDSQLAKVRSALIGFDRSVREVAECPSPSPHERAMSIRDAVLSRSEILSVEQSVGRICAATTVSCPPAVPIVISGERITSEDVALFKHYGISSVSVVK
jgi:arginine/lysine/ornithine decarboxylase